MDLLLDNKTFLVTGASSGFGKAVTESLLKENARVIAFARNIDKLKTLQSTLGDKLMLVPGDVLIDESLNGLIKAAIEYNIDGLFVNAGGPPAKSALETTLEDWDEGYRLLVRWKIQLVQQLIPHLRKKSNSRIIFNESISVKQPIKNLALSNSLRLAIVGYVKTLSQEVAGDGITVNVLAPGYHDTEALNRIFKKKSEQLNISVAEAKEKIIETIPVERLGKPENYATLAAWLFSNFSSYITGQTISIDGGVMQGVLG